MRIVVFQLLNDFSGSPKVLKSVIERFLAEGHTVDLYTSRGGPLDCLCSPCLKRHNIPYSFSTSAPGRVLRYVFSQILSFGAALRYIFSRDTIFYINTILPVGAAAGARIARKRVTLHCHEAAIARGGIYRIISRMMLRMVHEVICVSEFQKSQLPKLPNITIVPNTLSDGFIHALHPDPEAAFERKNVLMLCSLRIYKGVREFLSLAHILPQFSFTLVANDTEPAIDSWLSANGLKVPPNVKIYPRQTDVAPFYNNASVVVNLSNPCLFVETFGMTALEARACQLPVIVPTVGGIAEQVSEGVDGYHIDCHDIDRLANTITSLLTDRQLYMRLANALKSKNFS